MGGVAKTLLGTFGRSASLVRPGAGGAYDPATGTITGASTAVTYPCEIVFDEFSEGQIDGTLIKAGDRKALVSRLRVGVEPIPNSDYLTEGGRTWQIVRVMGYSSGAQEAAYNLQIRK